MSVVAKILIVVNLLLAVVFLGASASFLGQKESYKKLYDDKVVAYDSMKADLEAQVDENVKKFRQQELLATNAKGELDTFQAKFEQAEKDLQTFQDNFNKLQADHNRLSETYKDALAQIDALRNDKNQLIDEKDTALSEKRDAQGKMNAAVTEQQRLESENADLKDTVMGLEEQIVGLSKEIESAGVMIQAYKDKFGTISEWINVPALTAKVSAVDEKFNIVILSIGRDDGVKPGYEFTVYRGDKYVGKVIVDDVQKDHCSGYSRKELQSGEMQVGDDARTRW